MTRHDFIHAWPPAKYQHWRVLGRVQGVGFRPFVYRLARRCGLNGRVWNDGDGVQIVLTGNADALADFEALFYDHCPSTADIEAVRITEPDLGARYGDFRIINSEANSVTTEIVPDLAPCEECLSELLDPADRRYRYPFTNCTHCGPRYTIIDGLPYDRPRTSMATFTQCPACTREYRDPKDRRFHAQPNACATCGPRLTLLERDGETKSGSAALDATAERIRAGGIVAVKGVGGFQLLCDATNAATVQRLRERKHRPDKPFAVMVPNIASVDSWVHATAADRDRLQGPQAPIVLMPAHTLRTLQGIAPRLDQLGVMLASSPLHVLLFHAALGAPENRVWRNEPQPLIWVATSANRAGAPLVIDNDTAQVELFDIADAILLHDRAILQRCDDSVRQGGEHPLMLRRARGYTPARLPLGFNARPTLACGAGLKNTVCLARDRSAFLSQHIGDLDHPDTLAALEHTADHLLDTLSIEPEQIVCDAHPDLPSTRYAEHRAEQRSVPLIRVQHHQAHVAAVLAEHGIAPDQDQPTLGIALDGFGYGGDGQPWGGELFQFRDRMVERIGHLSPLPLPGGDAAAREPWRMALGVAHRFGLPQTEARFSDQPGFDLVRQMLDKGLNCPDTTSAGRWFDAVSALLGGPRVQTYEGQAAMELENLARRWPNSATPAWTDAYRVSDGVLDLSPALTPLLNTSDPRQAAWQWHRTLVAALVDWVEQALERTGSRRVVFSGGCLNNRLLRTGLVDALSNRPLEMLLPVEVPANDGGISLGQVWMAHFLGAV